MSILSSGRSYYEQDLTSHTCKFSKPILPFTDMEGDNRLLNDRELIVFSKTL
jgi:hypothetical protein